MVQYQHRIGRFGRLGPTRPVMAHEIAKLLLEHAGTFLERAEAVKSALALGMPLNEIEEYLDWMDLVRSQSPRAGQSPPLPKPSPPGETK
jgi:hypothetical protein